MMAHNAAQLSRRVSCGLARGYHDQSFGFRKARQPEVPDYTPSQLANRAKNAALLRYVDSMRMHGHRAAQIDPLDLLQREEVSALDPIRYGLTHDEAAYCVDGILWNRGRDALSAEAAGPQHWPLSRIEKHLRDTYVGRIAYEFMHSPSKTERLWFSHLLESSDAPIKPTSVQGKRRIWELLSKSEALDQFLQLKFPNLKRYGLEGAESMIPALDTLFAVAALAGVEHVVLAMPHRGRLNLLINLLKYPPAALFHKIKGGNEIPEELNASGDVISHLVSTPTLHYDDLSKQLKVSLLPNPSHLEAVNPVALGKARAKQYSLLRDASPDCMLGDKVMCVQLHGDGSFTGQGVVMESLGLSNLPHFTSGGSVHIVVNNNIGYTTPGTSARSSLYCSDVAKMINAPVLHCNGDYVDGVLAKPSPETSICYIPLADVVRAVEIAFKYRDCFRKDIVVDLITYRRWGHNELDEPSFTQPLMYEKIRNRKSVPEIYEEKLLAAGVIDASTASSLRAEYKTDLDAHLSASVQYKPQADMLQGKWSGLVWPASGNAVHHPETGVDHSILHAVGKASVSIPQGFAIHPRLQRHVKHRLDSLESGKGIDWATGEALAFGSLMLEGYGVRVSGQDVGRGTFSHRHAMFVDQKNEDVVVPLNAEISDDKGRLELANSSLSEFAVLGFEYGMSWENPKLLPIWEAQFGDFFNGAQVIIDTFISSAETKWLKQSGIVVVLPHGLDGAGPEHSSCRLERWLQLTNDPFEQKSDKNVNMHVANPTTPAQYFHLLRRQLHRNYRKPLILASPKALLRAPAAASSLDEFSSGTVFQPVIVEQADITAAERVILVTGKMYYDLAKERDARGLHTKVALVRIEELSPFPFEQLAELALAERRDVVWFQEEPKNQGAWSHVHARMERLRRVRYIGRQEDAVPAVGIAGTHKLQCATILKEAFAGL